MSLNSNRDSTHLIVETINGRWYIVSSLCDRSDTQVFTIERYTGRILYTGQPGVDLFHSPRDALMYLTKKKPILKNITKCHAIIGYTVIGTVALLCIATKVSLDLVLPPKHKVFFIQESKWLKINLAYPLAHLTKPELKNIDVLQEYQINGLHYYSETYDLTRQFPSEYPVEDYDPEFCWNDHLAKDFTALGMRKWCCVLMQGLSKENVVLDVTTPIHIAVICKRSSYNPGTRYNARGLNDKASPGNEYEEEQIVWKIVQGIVHWSRNVWRRGTVPIHWKSKINSAVSDADIIISEKPYEDIDVYYRRIMERYNHKPLTIVNLLRAKAVHADEGLLSEHYEESLNMIKKLMAIDVNMIKYDWHHILKLNGLNMAAEGLWNAIGSYLKNYGVTVGYMRISDDKVIESKITREQNGIVRVNCADSLDRTNLVCFFNSLQTIAEQCRQIGSTLCSNKKVVEEIASFESLNFTLDQMKQYFDNDLLVKLAEVYVNKGDVCAIVYTNTVAMHTSSLREFAQHLPAAPSNTKIIVERRIQNVLKDNHRQASIEMFLNINWNIYFPSHTAAEAGGKIRYLTPYPSYIFKSLPSEILTNKSEEYSLLRSAAKYCWICPRDYDYVEVHIYLPAYCRVTDLAITARHGLSEVTAPSKMDVFVGSHIDSCQMAFQEVLIPRCDDGTKLLYALPSQISGIVQDSVLYDFEGRVASSGMRVVRVTFYGIPPGAFMTLGQIQIFGIQEESGKPLKKFELELEQASSGDDIKKVMEALNRTELHQSVEKSKASIQENDDIKVEENLPSVTNAEEPNLLDRRNSQIEVDSDEDEDDVNEQEEIDPNSPPKDEATIKNILKSKSLYDDYFSSPRKEASKPGDELLKFISEEMQDKPVLSTEEKAQATDANPSSDLQRMPMDEQKAKEKYIKFLDTKAPKIPGNLTFNDVLELDLARLKLNLTPSQRNSILIEHGYKVKDFDPNLFVFHRDTQVEKVLRNRRKTNNCHLCRGSIKFKARACRYCRHSFCNRCMAKDKFTIIEYMWTNCPVCIECANTIHNQKSMIDEIQKHIELEEKKLKSKEDVYNKLVTQLHPASSLPDVNMHDDFEETCISTFPNAGILSSVDTDPSSPPIETILMSPSILKNQHWYSPQGVTNTTVIMVLPCNAELNKISLLVDKLGYNAHDAPIIRVSVADRLPNFKSIGYWDLATKRIAKQKVSSDDSKQLIAPFERIDLKFSELISKSDSTQSKLYKSGNCRILQLHLELNPEMLQKDVSILHLGRIYVYGKVNTPLETETLSAEDITKYEQIMKAKPLISRTQLQIENTVFHREIHTLDTYVSTLPNNKNRYVSGFRLFVQHGAAGIETQVQEIRVSVLSGGEDDQKEVSQELVGTFIVPKVATATNLYFDFAKTYQDIKIARFEFLRNYKREKELSYGTVYLYMNTQLQA